MYEFVDFTERGTQSTSLSIQTTFNGITLDEALTDDNGSFITLSVSGRSNMTNRMNTIEAPGLDGLIESSLTTLEAREIKIKYKITDRTNKGFRDRFNHLNSLLRVSKKELAFSDEEAIFYATLSSNEVPEETSNSVIGTLTFLCTDPYKYGPKQSKELVSDYEMITNSGLMPADPTFELEVLEPVTFALVQNHLNEFVMAGRPVDVKETPEAPETKVFHRAMDSLVGWTDTDVIAEGYLNGSMTHDDTGFIAEFAEPNFGEATWHGPAMKTSLSEEVQDFRAEMWLYFHTDQGGRTGRSEMYLLDATNNPIVRAFIEDKWRGLNQLGCQIEIANGVRTPYISFPPKLERFNGKLKVSRVGNQWTFTVQEFQDGRIVNEWVERLESDVAMQPAAQIQIAYQKWYDDVVERMEVYSMRLVRINDVENTTSTYIAQPEDVITFDHQSGDVLINGEPRMDLISFGAEFFQLIKGQNQIIVQPENAFNVWLHYRERFL
ncbi:distal tail protein Dit [Halobacillus massiliensis]|uniref:distal tail protein Dit n=1 Tax=Halobacillus massiliensis TaxID=1926286 RepID=UPI0009E1AB0C|nr:distal tail protein Dit [Halobacillus massiliensis]